MLGKLVGLLDLNLKTWCRWRTAVCAACVAPWERTSSGRWWSLTGGRLPGGSRSMASSLRPRALLTLLQSHSRSSRTPWIASRLKLDSILWVLSRCVVRCVLASSGLGRRLPRLYQGPAHFSSLNDLMKTRERRSERTADRLILYRTQMQMKLQKVLLLKYRTGAILFVRLLQVVFQPHKEGPQQESTAAFGTPDPKNKPKITKKPYQFLWISVLRVYSSPRTEEGMTCRSHGTRRTSTTTSCFCASSLGTTFCLTPQHWRFVKGVSIYWCTGEWGPFVYLFKPVECGYAIWICTAISDACSVCPSLFCTVRLFLWTAAWVTATAAVAFAYYYSGVRKLEGNATSSRTWGGRQIDAQ